MATEEQHAAAVVAALNSAGAHAYDYDDVPASPPDFYTQVAVSRRFGGTRRGSGEPVGQFYRILERAVANTVSNARNLRAKTDALEGTVLTIGGQTTTPIEFESAQPIGPDDGWFSGARTWTYALI